MYCQIANCNKEAVVRTQLAYGSVGRDSGVYLLWISERMTGISAFCGGWRT